MREYEKLRIKRNLRPDGHIQLGNIPIGVDIIHAGVKYSYVAYIQTATESYCLMRNDSGDEIKLDLHNFVKLA